VRFASEYRDRSYLSDFKIFPEAERLQGKVSQIKVSPHDPQDSIDCGKWQTLTLESANIFDDKIAHRPPSLIAGHVGRLLFKEKGTGTTGQERTDRSAC
jgi:hypothetical protein